MRWFMPTRSSSPGFETGGRPVEPDALTALREAHERGSRVVSICTGAFALAQAGLLEGRAATTHWADAAKLREEHPGTDVDAQVLWVDGGDNMFTSAGVAAGIDLALHLYALDHGAAGRRRRGPADGRVTRPPGGTGAVRGASRSARRHDRRNRPDPRLDARATR
jgi:transcriptional regulator GlxA family with amidase domain